MPNFTFSDIGILNLQVVDFKNVVYQKLKENGCLIDDKAKNLLKNLYRTTSNDYKIIMVSAKDFGITGNTTALEIKKTAISFGLKLCPIDVCFLLPELYKKQLNCGRTRIIPKTKKNIVLEIGNFDRGLFIHVVRFNPQEQFNADVYWIFNK